MDATVDNVGSRDGAIAAAVVLVYVVDAAVVAALSGIFAVKGQAAGSQYAASSVLVCGAHLQTKWPLAEEFLRLQGAVLMLDVVVACPGERYCHEMSACALQVLFLSHLLNCCLILLHNKCRGLQMSATLPVWWTKPTLWSTSWPAEDLAESVRAEAVVPVLSR